MGQAHFTDKEKDVGYCHIFVESFNGSALTWFCTLSKDSIDSLHDMSVKFLKHYIMFTRQGALASDLWKMFQAIDEGLREFMEKLRQVVSIVHIPDDIAVEALGNSL